MDPNTTPAKKANEIYQRFLFYSNERVAKESAIIAVDEIIKALFISAVADECLPYYKQVWSEVHKINQ